MPLGGKEWGAGNVKASKMWATIRRRYIIADKQTAVRIRAFFCYEMLVVRVFVCFIAF